MRLDTTRLEHDPAIIYAVDASLRIIYCNKAWDEFALANGGESVVRASQVGRDLAHAIPEPLRAFYWEAFDRVWSTGQPWIHNYECSSPDVFRKLQMRVTPLEAGDCHSPLIVVNSVCEESPHARTEYEALAGVYRNADKIVTMCCHCRRTQRAGGEAWDWVPEFVRVHPQPVSHGVCAPCFELHYGAFLGGSG